MVAAIVSVVVFSGVSFTQDIKPPKMPAKVRAFLNRMTGTWSRDGEVVGTFENNWDHGGSALIGTGNMVVKELALPFKLTQIWYWDGLSDNGVIRTWSASASSGFANGMFRGKVLSETIVVGELTEVRPVGQKVSGNLRIEFVSPDRYTWKGTNLIVAGVRKPDTADVITRVKSTTREDFQEFCKLNEGAWVGEATLEMDVPGIGKKGEKATAHYDYTIIEDGFALLGKSYWPDGTNTWLVAYDEGNKQVKTMGISPIFGIGITSLYKMNGKWHLKGNRSFPDGSKADVSLTCTYSDNGNTNTVSGRRIIDGETTEFTDVWRRMNK